MKKLFILALFVLGMCNAPVFGLEREIVLTELYPEICGVIVVAKGASDLKVRAALLCATQTFLNVTSDKIEILTMR